MSYTPTSWSTGDTISASALNKIEQGIANAGGVSYDAVITGGTYISNYNLTVVSGDRASIIAKLQDGDFVNILFYEINDEGGTGIRIGAIDEVSVTNGVIWIKVYCGTIHTGSIVWDSNGAGWED